MQAFRIALSFVCSLLFIGSALGENWRPLTLEIDGQWIGHGIAYGPHRDGQAPGGQSPSAEEILEDLRLLAPHWQLIRMYGSSRESETTLRLIREHRLPIRMILGAWINPEKNPSIRAENAAQVADAIRLAREYRELVLAVNVGNETQVHWSGHRCPPDQLVQHLRAVRTAIEQPVTTADDYNFWNKPESVAVAQEVDFLMMHAYALWNGRQLEEAMAWTGEMYEAVCRQHPGRLVIIGETGWATSHDAGKQGPGQEGTLMKAETSVRAQAEYLRQHQAWVKSKKVATFLFEAFDETWKGSGPSGSPLEAEKHWGVFDSRRRPKESLRVLLEP